MNFPGFPFTTLICVTQLPSNVYLAYIFQMSYIFLEIYFWPRVEISISLMKVKLILPLNES